MNLTNTQFKFESRTKNVLVGGMLLGVLCLVLVFVNDDEYHTRFWTNFLHNSVYFTGIAILSMFFMSAQITAFAGWNTVIRRIWEAMSQFIWVGIILMGIIALGVWAHFHHLYHWNDPNVNVTDPAAPHYDRIIAGKKGFLNPVFFTVATVGFLSLWYFWTYKLRQLSVEQDSDAANALSNYKKQRRWAASFLPIAGFLSPVFLWLVMMSLDPHWYSTMFAWYSTASVWLGAISLTVLIIIYLKSRGYLEYVTYDHLHDLGKYLFGISVFWTYLWFDQFMLIWYANNGEETIYFNERMTSYPVLFWGNLLMNFVAPFLILMRNDTKRKFGTMFFVALIVFFGHWWDYFYMIKPGARIAAFEAKELAEGVHGKSHDAAPLSEAKPTENAVAEQPVQHLEGTAHGDTTVTHSEEGGAPHATEKHPAAEAATAPIATHGEEGGHGDAHGEKGGGEPSGFRMGFTIPGLEEIGTLVGFISLFMFFFFRQLERVSLIPKNDPFLEESLHHETGALIESEQAEKAAHGHAHH
jgi:hypothetical protein